MAGVADILDNSQHKEGLNILLISGLPDDIVVGCLARVPWKYHHNLRLVSRRWRALLSSEEWQSYRRNNNFEETWIFAFCRHRLRGYCFYVLDPTSSDRTWKPLQTFPLEYLNKEGMSFETVDEKLYLLGGCSFSGEVSDKVYCYNSFLNKWEDAASMPAARCFFASAALNNKLYVTRGLGVDLDLDVTRTWDIFDPRTSTWCSESGGILFPEIQKCLPFDGKIYLTHKSPRNEFYVSVYDPSCKASREVSNEMNLCWRGPTVIVDGTLYMLEETFGTRLMMWVEETEVWVALGRLAHVLVRPPCQLVAIGRKIFVIGKGLNTVVVDVDTAWKVDRVLVSSSFSPKMDADISVLGCQTLSV